jgi:hypothetical protein
MPPPMTTRSASMSLPSGSDLAAVGQISGVDESHRAAP